MMSKKKDFDCVEMQHEGGARVRAIIKDMTVEEQVAYWKTRTEALRRLQETVRAERKSA